MGCAPHAPWHASCIKASMKPLSPESRRQQPASPLAWLLREIAVVLVLKVVALTALWWAFFSSSSQERPPPVDLSRTFLERQPVSPVSPARSPE
jgi:cytoskeletal protein RodZ